MNHIARISMILCAGVALSVPALAAAAEESTKIDLAAALAEFQLPESSRTVKELIPNWVVPQKLVVVVDKPERTAWLQQAMPAGVTVVGVRRDAEAQALLADADALIEVNCAIAVGDAPKPRLKWVHGNSGGGDTCLNVTGIARGEIVMTNSQKVKNTVLAEMGMGYVFALARSIDVGLENQRQRDLGKRGGRPGKRLEGSTMLIVGLGGAGTEIARMAHAVGMKVIATDPVNRNPPDFVSHLGMPDELPALVGQADVVMIAAPLTPQTRGLFNAAMFARMKRDAIFVNWARADIVVPEDLAAALKNGTIGSAALNWATQTPLAKDHPLWDAPNLILSPWAGTPVTPSRDVSAKAARDNELRWYVVRENMRRYATGGKMYSVFDLARGY
jgi:phosphoglycerate dehydrogenase-like enzyme